MGWKRMLSIALLTTLLCAGCAKAPAAIEETPEPTATPVPVMQKDLVVLYTNDVHCAVDGEETIGYAGLATIKREMEASGNYVLLVDAGDAIQGAPIGTLSKGEYIVDIMDEVGYDVATPGNHEFDYGMERFFELTERAEFPYVSANFTDLKTGALALSPYVIREFDGVKIAFVGVSTPRTITSSTPAYFQDEDGNFIYGFCQDESGQAFYDAVQKAVNDARQEGAFKVIALSHLGIEAEASPYTSSELIENTTGIDAVLDGHSHSVVYGERVKNKDGEHVLLSSTGTGLTAVGELYITKSGNVSTGLVTELPEKNPEVTAYIDVIKSRYSSLLDTVVANTEVELTIVDPMNPTVRLVRSQETNLGDLSADAYRAITGADIALVNGGGVRENIKKGSITYGNILAVHPFGNYLCMVEATGQEILDALEIGTRSIPGESGGFLQVSGLTYEIHSYLRSAVKMDESNMFVSVDGEYRVKNVTVNGEALELDKVYTVASHNYLIQNGGDGINVFANNALVLDKIMLDNQALIQYITENLGGTVGAAYADPYGQGRILFVTRKPRG